MREIKQDVFIEDRFSTHENYRGCNYGFVTTSAGTVIIDTPEWPSEAVDLREIVSEYEEPYYIINTHEHFDHVIGNYYIPGTVISHESVRDAVASSPSPEDTKLLLEYLFEGEVASRKQQRVETFDDGTLTWEDVLRLVFEELNPDSLSLIDGYEIREPSITFSEDATMHVGDYTFRLLHLPGHTESHIGVYIPERNMFFTGDNVATQVYPSFAASNLDDWLASLHRIETFDIDYIVPGHGKTGSKDDVEAFRVFLEECRERVNSAIDEALSVEEAIDEVSFSDLRPALHQTEAAHQYDIERLYEMNSGQRGH